LSRNILILVILLVIVLYFVIAFVLYKLKNIKRQESAQKVGFFAWCLVIAALILMTLIYVTNIGHYDRYGNYFSSGQEVLYYSLNNKIYTYSGGWYGESTFNNINNSEEKYIDTCAFISMDGYIYFDINNSFIRKEKSNKYYDLQGNEYFRATDIYWNCFGLIKYYP
jgi:hypothetical protein